MLLTGAVLTLMFASPPQALADCADCCDCECDAAECAKKIIKKYDTDDDGKLSKDEVEKWKGFDKMDANSDGFIDQSELKDCCGNG